jgi:gliding motility-associated-like protein
VKLKALSLLLFQIVFVSWSFAQMKLMPGETFLGGLAMKKVFVSVEDHTVWALSPGGKVYYKREADPDFLVYPQTAAMVISDITGFSEAEMYFLVSPRVITFKNGLRTDIPIPFSGVTRINSISVVHVKLLLNRDADPHLPNKDWLAVATNKDMYMLDRGKTSDLRKYRYDNEPVAAEPDWQISNTGYNSVDFRFKYPSGRCFDADYATHTTMDDLLFWSTIPDKGQFPAVNCTLYGNQYFAPFVGNSDYRSMINFWGTNNGIYAKNAEACFAGLVLRKVLDAEVINDLEEIYALTPIYKQNFVLAATNRGLYYTPASVYHELPGATEIGQIKFIPLTAISEKVNSVCVDTKVYNSLQVGVQYTYTSMCQKVVWLATEQGIKKLYVSLDQDYYQDFRFGDFNFSARKTNTDFEKAVFQTCGEQTVTASIRLPALFQNQLLVQWFKGDVEKADWTGKMSVTIEEAGTYHARITSLCEGIALNSIPIIVNNNTDPEITFNYPPEMTSCASAPLTFNTIFQPGYSFKWFRDDVLIQGPSANASYTARIAGTYRVEVSNCAGYYKSSAPVKLKVDDVPAPVIITDKPAYCSGDAALLRVDNPGGYRIIWYFNGEVQNALADQTTISVLEKGNYVAAFENAASCGRASAIFKFEPQNVPRAIIERSINRSLCYGETVRLSTAAISGGIYKWNTGETTSSITVTTAGKYFVEVTSTTGCSVKSEEADVQVLPPLQLSKPDDVKICTISGEQVKLSAERGYQSYIWNGRRGDDFLEVSQAGQYTLEVEDANGCKATTVFVVIPWCKDLLMPNTFSPNGDGINDFWTVGGLENDPGARISIFNRNGSLLFETRGDKPVWDGKYRGSDLPVGVYYYSIITKNSAKALSGWITIIR